MLSFLGIRDFIYIGIIASAIGGVWYFIDDWHYKPLREYKTSYDKKSLEYDRLMIEHSSLGQEYQRALDTIEKAKQQGFKEGKKDAIDNTSFINPTPFSIK